MDLYERVTERIMEQLHQGVVPWRQPWDSTAAMPRNGVSGRRYRGVNAFLLSLAGYSSPYWLTYRQARQLGGHVRKGERGTVALLWKLLQVVRDDHGERVERVVPLLRHYTVFNLAQTEGVTLPERVRAEAEAAKARPEPVEAADAIVAGYLDAGGPKIVHGAAGAFYRPSLDVVHMPDPAAFRTQGDYYATLFHELAHSTGHPSRLARLVKGTFGSHDYGREELVAEMGAAFLCAEAGVVASAPADHAAYVAGWLRVLREDPRAVVVAAGAAQRAVDLILGRRFAEPDEE